MTLRMWIYWNVMTVSGPNQSICPVILTHSVGQDHQTREETTRGSTGSLLYQDTSPRSQLYGPPRRPLKFPPHRDPVMRPFTPIGPLSE